MAENMIKNLDVAHLADIISRDIREVVKFQSSFTASLIIPADRGRLQSYVRQYEGFTNWAVEGSRGENGKFACLDLPRTHPQVYPLVPCLSIEEIDVENELIRTVARHLIALRHELVTSQSSQLASGLLPADEGRVRSIIERLYRLLNTYVDEILPIDQPETSTPPNPQRA